MLRNALLPWIKCLLSRYCSVQIFYSICISRGIPHKANIVTNAEQRRQRKQFSIHHCFFPQIILFQPVLPSFLISYSVRGSFPALPQTTFDHCTNVFINLFIQILSSHAPNDSQWESNRQNALTSQSLHSSEGRQIKSNTNISVEIKSM